MEGKVFRFHCRHRRKIMWSGYYKIQFKIISHPFEMHAIGKTNGPQRLRDWLFARNNIWHVEQASQLFEFIWSWRYRMNRYNFHERFMKWALLEKSLPYQIKNQYIFLICIAIFCNKKVFVKYEFFILRLNMNKTVNFEIEWTVHNFVMNCSQFCDEQFTWIFGRTIGPRSAFRHSVCVIEARSKHFEISKWRRIRSGSGSYSRFYSECVLMIGRVFVLIECIFHSKLLAKFTIVLPQHTTDRFVLFHQ